MEVVPNIVLSMIVSLASMSAVVAFVAYLENKRVRERRNEADVMGPNEGRLVGDVNVTRLTNSEKKLLSCLVDPSSLRIEPTDLFGLEDVYADLVRRAVFPIICPSIYSTTLLSPALGVLLYGPPGTGKTMLAKVLAHKCECRIMIISPADVMNKYIGNSENAAHAIFTLAQKLEPCIVFIDEVDALFGTRGRLHEHETARRVKTTFLQHWDGIATRKPSRILVIGTTNREEDIDSAFLRRFDIKIKVPLPNFQQRVGIIRGYLSKHISESENGSEALSPSILSEQSMGVEDRRTVIEWLAQSCEGFSGSDLRQLCAFAVKRPVDEAMSQNNISDIVSMGRRDRSSPFRPCDIVDFEESLRLVRMSLANNSHSGHNTAAVHPELIQVYKRAIRRVYVTILGPIYNATRTLFELFQFPRQWY